MGLIDKIQTLNEIFQGQSIIQAIKEQCETLGIEYRPGDFGKDNETMETIRGKGLYTRLEPQPGLDQEDQQRYAIEQIGGLDGVIVLTSDLGLFPQNMNGNEMRKKLELVGMPRSRGGKRITQGVARNERIGPRMLLREAAEGLDITRAYVGYDWQGLRLSGRQFKVTTLVDCIMGCYLYSNTELGKDVSIDPYFENGNAIVYGGKAHITVPSMSIHGRAHEVWFSGVPIKEKKEDSDRYYATWFDLTSETTSPKPSWSELSYYRQRGIDERKLFRRTGTEQYFDFHDVSAYLHLIWYTYRVTDMRVAANPFVLPTEDTTRMFEKIRHDVFLEEVQEDGTKEYRSLNQAHTEILLWKYVASEGYDRTLAGTGRFREYMKIKE